MDHSCVQMSGLGFFCFLWQSWLGSLGILRFILMFFFPLLRPFICECEGHCFFTRNALNQNLPLSLRGILYERAVSFHGALPSESIDQYIICEFALLRAAQTMDKRSVRVTEKPMDLSGGWNDSWVETSYLACLHGMFAARKKQSVFLPGPLDKAHSLITQRDNCLLS